MIFNGTVERASKKAAGSGSRFSRFSRLEPLIERMGGSQRQNYFDQLERSAQHISEFFGHFPRLSGKRPFWLKRTLISSLKKLEKHESLKNQKKLRMNEIIAEVTAFLEPHESDIFYQYASCAGTEPTGSPRLRVSTGTDFALALGEAGDIFERMKTAPNPVRLATMIRELMVPASISTPPTNRILETVVSRLEAGDLKAKYEASVDHDKLICISQAIDAVKSSSRKEIHAVVAEARRIYWKKQTGRDLDANASVLAKVTPSMGAIYSHLDGEKLLNDLRRELDMLSKGEDRYVYGPVVQDFANSDSSYSTVTKIPQTLLPKADKKDVDDALLLVSTTGPKLIGVLFDAALQKDRERMEAAFRRAPYQ